MDERAPTDEPVEYAREDVSVLVVGAGAAGARAAIELAERGVDDVLVLGKRGHGDAHTTWARGGINGALGTHDPEDSPAIHAADTLNEGHLINDPGKVETVTAQMPERLRELDDWGMAYSRTDDGAIDQRFFGAQSFRRTAFAGDHTGESLLNTLVDRAQALSVPYRENVMITKLVSDGEAVHGAVGFDMDDGEFVLFNAGTVVLAAGGHAAIYNRHTSRDDENNGDGAALAFDAGASLMDMEFMQFHPTGMAVDEADPEWAPWSGRLVTEAVRGEGGRLFNAEGERFMERYSPDQMELDARDVVARAIAREIGEGRGTEHGGVYLDISHRDADFIEERLPRMYERFQDLGVDMAEEPVEVAPTSHYGMGGVAVDDHGETDVDGLFAIGETMAGVHGANRLGGNSLAETVAYGVVAGERIADRVDGPGEVPDALREETVEPHLRDLRAMADNDGANEVDAVLADLRELMWEHAGILRDESSLREGLDRLAAVRDRAADMRVGPVTSESFELAVDAGFMLVAAEAVLRGALEREESRGAHYRTDHPDTDPDWRRNVYFDAADVGGMTLRTEPVDQPSDAVQAALDEGHELDYHQLE
ncbi:FAD-dependent oxidoreductase [Halorubrum ezzemoulense]|uniref:FAD-dependent oxidoreductase n=1 Tax=Halorubrum ezzemoulense TaxID=337243 RepID=A0A256K4G2_HALEZ|nr:MULTISPECIES: FAD-dependent oxidoreductase [Halorubrum]MDB2225301.1 FAD-dependent oxidoreductase [Halorubrum ezzemoulense]MDB2239821.1 FAD-dependent oxidoreductase [Halorubrum ezzemoulense]MDB2244226.1 FAD-dependent oxidoreductase [Halorubrum ezzemoulense]MDB2252328.1 FAD-dependent oxidoreductase [Halorubrum ezzemoulense]MDB2277961.1 FAD-dependent oxidoreductase [Halorubrum ezzemoulense]